MPSFVSPRTPRLVFFLLLVIGLAVVALAPASRALRETEGPRAKKVKSSKPDFVPGEVLVRYRSESQATKQPRVLALRSAEGSALSIAVERFEGADLVPGLRLARVDAENTMRAIEALRKQPDVLYAEPNYILRTAATPNDPRFGDLYGMNKIGAPLAWDTNIGSPSVVVGVIDQGVDLNHEDLNGNRFVNPSPGAISGIAGDINGWNFRDGNAVLYSGDPDEAHASHVAGIIGAVGNNNTGVVGVNWTVKLMSLKFLDGGTGAGDTADAISACSYAKAMRDLYVSSGGTQGANVRVLNNSYGGGGFNNAFLNAIDALNQSGILFVAAAGNVDPDPEQNNDLVPHYPSSYNAPNVIAVANTTSDDSINNTEPCGSHFGPNSVHLGAPGTNILSTVPVGPPSPTGYSSFCGTSMATPHVSGAAALLLAQNPNLTVKQLKALLLFNGDVITGASGLVDKTITGRRLNVGKSFQALAEGDFTPPGAVTNLHINNQNGRSFNIGWNASGDDGPTGQAALYELAFADSKTGAVIPLKTAVPFASGASQTVDVKVPYRHTTGTIRVKPFDNVGNEGALASVAVAVTFAEGDPYATTLSVPVALSTGGSRLFGGPNDDDQYSDFLMPQGFTFPFFGANFTSVKISTNGNLFFGNAPTRINGEADDVPGSTADLVHYEMISGLWDDIDLRSASRADAGVYIVQPSPNRIIFRWQGVPCNFGAPEGQPLACQGGAPINFEIELNTDGTIKSRYGSTGSDLFPVVGISGGEPEAYVITSHTSEDAPFSLNNAPEVTYIPRNVINPLDNSFFFTSQQYRDLLGREADLGGLAFWAAEIDACQSDNIECLVNRRTRVSAAFFVENEFQRTGSFVYRSFKGGLGRQPLFAEFVADRPLIVEGPNLEQTKQAYSLSFVQRPEFVTKYSGLTTADAFVNRLVSTIQATSGVSLNSGPLITAYESGTDQNSQRALALRAAIDNAAFTQAEYNPSFVLMQYFGYLNRDPDIGGYDFWLNVLDNREPNNFRGMVCSFITSTEYQQRFSSLVPHSNQECQLYIRFQ